MNCERRASSATCCLGQLATRTPSNRIVALPVWTGELERGHPCAAHKFGLVFAHLHSQKHTHTHTYIYCKSCIYVNSASQRQTKTRAHLNLAKPNRTEPKQTQPNQIKPDETRKAASELDSRGSSWRYAGNWSFALLGIGLAAIALDSSVWPVIKGSVLARSSLPKIPARDGHKFECG